MALAASASSTRQEITRALSPAGTKSATAKYLAQELGAPIRYVREELEAMGRDGTVKVRRLRSGEVLFKLRTSNDAAWEAQNGLSYSFPTRN